MGEWLSFSGETGTVGLFIGLFVAAFVSATVLPGGSEVVLIAVLHQRPDLWWQAVLLASIGNTLGSMTSFLIGRMIPNNAQGKAIVTVHRYGYWILLFAWVPLAGDALCVAAGWLRFSAWWSLVMIAIGKFVRYVLVGGAWSWIEAASLPSLSR